MTVDYEKVKSCMGITDHFQDTIIFPIIDSVLDYMKGAGVPDDVFKDENIVYLVARGTLDLWNYGSGGVGFSQFFRESVIQHSLKNG